MLNRVVSLGFGLMVVALLGACLDPPDFDDVPKIEFVSVNKTKVKGSALFNPNPNLPPDTLRFTIKFEDGDGNIGIADDNQDTCAVGDSISFIQAGCDAFMIDSRTGYVNTYRIPEVTPKGNIKAISGEIQIEIYSPFICIIPFGSNATTDTVQYTIMIKDQMDSLSNPIVTPPIIIDCAK